MEEDSLALKISSGDHKAFEELFEAYRPVLISYARLFLNGECAEDVVQDVFFSLWKHRENLNGEGSVQGYLLKSTYNAAMNCLAKRGRDSDYRSWYQRKIEEMAAEAYNPESNEIIAKIYSKDLRARIDGAILRLPPKCREAFCLSYVDGLSNKQIAKRLGISVSTVENHLYSALKKLREMLKEPEK